MPTLLAGTASGLWAIAGGKPAPIGLPGQLITHLAAGQHTLLAAVPRCGPVHRILGDMAGSAEGEAPGLHAASMPSQLPAELEWRQVWHGDARSCALDEPSGTWFAGTEPADVCRSPDGGKTWQDSGGFASIPGRASWSFPAPPHEPHVLSIEAFRTAQGNGALHVVAGIEVGGALLSSNGGASWRDTSKGGLYEDVHSCRVDPWDPSRWYAVTGRGLYRTTDGGASWSKLMESLPRWYTIGLALNPEREGEVLVAAGDRPPSIGMHVAHSTDGGDTWQDLTEGIFRGEAAEAKGRLTPVPYFLGGQSLLGTNTGHVLSSSDPERRSWRVLCRLPHPVLCFAAQGQSPSSVMH